MVKQRIPVSELKQYYAMYGGDPSDLRYVTHAYKNEKLEYFARIPLSDDLKNMVCSVTTTK